MFMAGCGCGCCDPVFTDDFNRADSSDIGASWVEISSGAEIKSNTLQTSSPALIRTTGVTHPTVVIDSTTYAGSSKVSVKWTPLDTVNPNTSHVVLGQRDILGGTAISRYIGLELKCDSSGIAPTISARLYAAGPTYVTDSLLIGWDDGPQYTSSSTPSGSDKFFDVTLCWEAENQYTTFRGQMKVKATISSYTGAFYTLEATITGAPTIQDVFLESEAGDARWDDFSWSKTAPDFPECPYCGQCLFAADMTTADDNGTAAYSSSGGTFARNVTTGALELTSTTATWLVDLPARSSLSLTYSADWSGASPTFDVEIGGIRLQISKTITPDQVIAVTVNGSGATSIYTSLTNDFVSICFNAEKIVVATTTTHNEYTSLENTGYVNLAMTAGSSKVSVTEIQALRSDDTSVARLGCTPCDLDTDTDCSVCPPAAFAPYGAVIVTHETTYDEYTNYWGAFTLPDTPPALGDACAGVTPTPCDMAQFPDMLPNALVCAIGGTCSTAALDGADTQVCCWTFNDQRTIDFTSCNDNMYVAALMQVVLYKTADATPRYYLASRFLQNSTWSFTPAGGTVKLWRCVGGNVAGFTTDSSLGDAAGSTAYHSVDTGTDYPLFYSDYFTDCDKVDFTLTRTGAGTLRGFFWDMNFPSSITVHVPR